MPERERETLARALRTRPPGSDPLTVVDYLYLGQLPALLFASEVWQYVKPKLNVAADAKQLLEVRLLRSHLSEMRLHTCERSLRIVCSRRL